MLIYASCNSRDHVDLRSFEPRWASFFPRVLSQRQWTVVHMGLCKFFLIYNIHMIVIYSIELVINNLTLSFSYLEALKKPRITSTLSKFIVKTRLVLQKYSKPNKPSLTFETDPIYFTTYVHSTLEYPLSGVQLSKYLITAIPQKN